MIEDRRGTLAVMKIINTIKKLLEIKSLYIQKYKLR